MSENPKAERNGETRHESDDRGRGERRPYQKPVLTEYGSISKLTRSGGKTRSEGGSPKSRAMGCL